MFAVAPEERGGWRMGDGGFENGKRERRGDNVFCSRWENEISSRLGRRRRSYS